MRMFLASILKPVVGSAQLSELGFQDRLISYFVAREHTVNPDADLRYFVEHGDAPPYKKARNYHDKWKSPVYIRRRRLELVQRIEGRGHESSEETNLHAFTNSAKISLMLDSGVFSTWKRGNTINIDEYIDFVKRNQDIIEICVNLDVIPSKYGQARTIKQVEDSAKESYDNLKYMQSKGLQPLPVFHRGEPF